MLAIIQALQGKKTYLIMAIGVLLAILGYLTGQTTLPQTIEAVIVALGFGTVRAGSKNDAKAVIESRPTTDSSKIE